MRIAVGLSGGVDSSVVALMMKEAGYDVVGITMRLWREGRYRGGDRAACFGPNEEKTIAQAADFAKSIGIEHRVFDCHDEYEREIIRYFREASLQGLTPNPCVICNAEIKFGLLPRVALDSGLSFDMFATGHYARIVRCANGRYAVARAADEKKDQSYFLYRLTQEQLACSMFPLGGMTKRQVRAFAAEKGLSTADRLDSQDFYSGDKNELVGAAEREGDIVDAAGNVLGRHSGFWHYTVGQRKGIGVYGPKPHYVIRLDACRNQVVVGSRQEAFRSEFRVGDLKWMASAPAENAIRCKVKIRSTGAPLGPVTIEGGVCRSGGDGLFGVAPGQSAVFYDDSGNIILGGVIA